MSPSAASRPSQSPQATAKTPGGVWLPKLPDGWQWKVAAHGPDDAGILVDAANRVTLQSDAYNPPAVPTGSLADAAREVQKIARAHDALLGIFPKPTPTAKPVQP